MAFTELIVILIVAIIVLKPEDYGSLIKGVSKFYKYITSLRAEIDKEIEKIAIDDISDASDEINFYLQKIFDLEEKYTGEYNIHDVKAYYHKTLLKKKISHKE